jgi:hypothetical protein
MATLQRILPVTRRNIRTSLVFGLATFLVFTGANLACATGHWNVPSTFYQWSGYGFGGGYHAPLVLGPATHEYLSAPNEVRLQRAPNPYGCAPYCNGGSCGANGPAMMTPNAQPDPGPQQTSPAPVPESPLFAPPVQSQGGSW